MHIIKKMLKSWNRTIEIFDFTFRITMNSFTGYSTSFSGFVDYSKCYPEKEGIWIAIGGCIFLGTLISMIPQTVVLVKNKSNYGLNPFMVFMNNLCSILLTVNTVTLHFADFVGLNQYSFFRALPTLFTFFNNFLLWFGYLPVVLLTIIFFDVVIREKRKGKEIKVERYEVYGLDILLSALTVIFFMIYVIVGYKNGFSSSNTLNYGKTLGIICSVFNILLWLPQIITTCKLRDNGSLSLVYLGIQAPGGLINTCFLVFGQHENWTTWLPIFASCCQQLLLLIICIVFKLRKRSLVKKINDEALLSPIIQTNQI